MGNLLYDTLEVLFMGSAITEIADFLSVVMTSLKGLFTQKSIADRIGSFMAVAGSVMTIYLFMHVMEKASQNMLTLEQLILIFIRYFIAMIILIYLVDIVTTLFGLASGIYDMAKGWINDKTVNAFGNLRYFPNDGNKNPNVWPDYDMIKDAFYSAGYKDKITSFVPHVGKAITCILINMILWVAKIAAYFITIGNAISLIARTAFSPLGVVQLFDEGQRSAGIRYMKKLLAEALVFAVILGILYASSLIQASVLSTQLKETMNGVLSVSVIDKIFSLSTLPVIIAIQVSAIGAMFKATQLANDIIGV